MSNWTLDIITFSYPCHWYWYKSRDNSSAVTTLLDLSFKDLWFLIYIDNIELKFIVILYPNVNYCWCYLDRLLEITNHQTPQISLVISSACRQVRLKNTGERCKYIVLTLTKCKTVVFPLLTHSRYRIVEQSHHYDPAQTLFSLNVAIKWIQSSLDWLPCSGFNTLRPRQNGRHFQMHFLEWKCMNFA